ncbi:MAG: hypothetical protein IPK68_06630 [Bdellovibrionales bacterium]|nr:hypothetical protein [Bdellovibrionales bacterium]
MFEIESVRPLSTKGEISPFVIEDWGLIVYQEAVQKQMELVQAVKNGSKPDTLVFCQHHPVVTLGRATEEEDIQGWQGEILETSRGGRATYHGPSQLVVYPIFSLERERGYLARPRDVHSYLRCLEACLVASLVSYELPAEVKSVGVIDNTSLRNDGSLGWKQENSFYWSFYTFLGYLPWPRIECGPGSSGLSRNKALWI